MAKVIHVHLFTKSRVEKKDYYFSSIAAIYDILTVEDIGVKYSYLRHAGLSGNGCVMTKKAIIRQDSIHAKNKKGPTFAEPIQLQD